MKQLYVITGQTATGKTDTALSLAEKHNGELINCDSRQIYKKLDIITGKDLQITDGDFNLHKSLENFDIGFYTVYNNEIPLWLYDITKPHYAFSAFDYRQCALDVITDIFNRNKTPILVGGTYFYLKHLLYGTVQTNVEPNPALREELNNKTVAELQEILQEENERIYDSLNESDRANPHRLIRKIEINREPSTPPQEIKSIVNIFSDLKITMDGYYFSSRDALQKTITQRVEKRLQAGAIQEVESLLSLGYTGQEPGLKTIGYTQIIQYLHEEIDYEKMKAEWITKEVQYAKRQYTFMKKDSHITWHEL